MISPRYSRDQVPAPAPSGSVLSRAQPAVRVPTVSVTTEAQGNNLRSMDQRTIFPFQFNSVLPAHRVPGTGPGAGDAAVGSSDLFGGMEGQRRVWAMDKGCQCDESHQKRQEGRDGPGAWGKQPA